jgi:hypothetical protein
LYPPEKKLMAKIITPSSDLLAVGWQRSGYSLVEMKEISPLVARS